MCRERVVALNETVKLSQERLAYYDCRYALYSINNPLTLVADPIFNPICVHNPFFEDDDLSSLSRAASAIMSESTCMYGA